MPVRKSGAWVTLVFGCVWCSFAWAAEHFATRLDTVPIDRRTQAEVSGDGTARAQLSGSELTVEGTFSGLAGAATEAWLHMGTAIGARGPALHELDVEHDSSGTLRGTVRLNRREREALEAGRVYIQIHSEAAPDGNLWGWLLAEE